MASIVLAIVYIGGWILSMRIFGYFWKRRKLAINFAEPWFPEHVPRNQYIALLQQSEPEASEVQLTAALLRRAMEDVVRVLSMREDKQILANLVKQGTLGEDIWTQFTLAEKELEAEVMEVIAEANTFKEGWGQSILQTASEMVMHEKTKQLQKEMKTQREDETRKHALKEKNAEAKKEKERAKATEELLKEEEKEKAKAATSSKKK